MLCPRCGNEIEAHQACPICSEGAEWKKTSSEEGGASEPRSFLCTVCGNEVVGEKECPVCRAGRAPVNAPSPEDTATTFCPGCGNEVENAQRCPICRSGRASGKTTEESTGLRCPRCDDPLEEQDWEGLGVHLCPTCNGSFFPPGGLETTLDKLRAHRGATDLETVCREFRDRFTRELPEAMRYKPCPVCDTFMTRLNYAGSSGIIVELCGHHGTWVDQSAFGSLTDFVSRGGDLIQSRRRR